MYPSHPLHLFINDQLESPDSCLSFKSSDSLDLAIPRLRAVNSNQKEALKMEKNIISYLDGLGLQFKTDARQKEYNHHSQPLNRFSLELVDTLQECTEENQTHTHDFDDLGIKINKSREVSVKDETEDVNNELNDVLQSLNVFAPPSRQLIQPLQLKSNPLVKRRSQGLDGFKNSLSMGNGELETKSNSCEIQPLRHLEVNFKFLQTIKLD